MKENFFSIAFLKLSLKKSKYIVILLIIFIALYKNKGFNEFIEFNYVEFFQEKPEYVHDDKFLWPRLIAHAGGGVADDESYTNSLQALNLNYDRGFRFFEVDIEWTRDNNLVLIHDWEESSKRLLGLDYSEGYYKRVCFKFGGVNINSVSLNKFNELKTTGKFRKLTFDDMADWLGNHKDAYIITDIKWKNEEALQKIKDSYPGLIGQVIPQIYKIREFVPVKKIGYKRIILTLYIKNYSDEMIEKSLKLFHFDAVTMPLQRALGGLPERIKNEKMVMFAHTVNDEKVYKKLLDLGITGVYTDFLIPQKKY